MFLATLHTIDQRVQIQVTAPDIESLQKVIAPFSACDFMSNIYDINANGSKHFNGINPALKYRPYSDDNRLSDLRKHLPKHPGGRPRKPTACKTCSKVHDSYTAAKVCCWQERMKGKNK